MANVPGGSLRVSIAIQPGGLSARHFGNGVFLRRVASAVADRAEAEQLRGVQTYTSANAVQSASVADEILAAANIWFGQQPFPRNLLVGANIAAIQPAFVFSDPDNTGTIAQIEALGDDTGLTVNGSAFTADFDGLTTFDAIAAALQTGIRNVAGFAAATVTYDASGGYFAFQNATSFGSGFGVSSAEQTLGLGTSGVSVLAPVAAAETPSESLDRILAVDDNFFWVGVDPAIAADFALADSVRDWVAARTWQKGAIFDLFGADVLVANESGSIGARLSAQGGDGIGAIYNGLTQASIDQKALSYMARFSSVNFDQPNAVPNGKLLQLRGTTPTTLDQDQKNELDRKRINFYQPIPGATLGDTAEGKTFGTWIDVYYSLAWFRSALASAGYDSLKRNRGIPITDDGVAALADDVEAVCEDAVVNGVLAPGTVSPGLQSQIATATRNPEFDGTLSTGYLVVRPRPIDIQQSVRNARGPIPVKIYAKGSGRVNFLEIDVLYEQ